LANEIALVKYNVILDDHHFNQQIYYRSSESKMNAAIFESLRTSVFPTPFIYRTLLQQLRLFLRDDTAFFKTDQLNWISQSLRQWNLRKGVILRANTGCGKTLLPFMLARLTGGIVIFIVPLCAIVNVSVIFVK
jgi:superfamily II DNA helicase RecQ